ncbi:MAG: ATP-binding cassette domain-containing protein [Alphaproteobacteria bacterium]|nr:ATP-binding cassette domain-containing protein [Alphaproteobacteria bacterium]
MRTSSGRRLRLVRQATYFECGLACLVMVSRAMGSDVSLAGVRKMCPPSARGMTLNGLVEVAKQLGLEPVPVAINLAALAELELPAVLHWGFSHYVVLSAFDGRNLTILDPSYGRRRVSLEQAAPLVTGVAIEFVRNTPPTGFLEAVKPLRFGDLLPRKRALLLPASLGLAVSLCLELLLVLTPWLVARMLDRSSLAANAPVQLAMMGLLVLAVLMGTRIVRSALVVHLSGATQRGIMATAFRRLLDKPPSFFEQRYSTYIVSRFEGTDRLRTLLSEDYLNASIDVIMLIVLLVAIGTLSPLVMLLTAAAATLVGAIRFVSGVTSRELMDEVVHARSLERLHLMESVRAIRALKLFGKTSQRLASYGLRVDNSVTFQGNYAWHRGLFDAASAFVSDCAWIGLTLYLVLAPGAVHGRGASILALIFYVRMLMDRASLLSGKVAEIAAVKVQLEHLADIVEEEPAEAARRAAAPPFESLRISGLSFDYGGGAPLLRDVALEVAQGEFVAVAGPSGSGKTTLLKIVAGLLPRTSGSILWSGVDADLLDPASLDRARACVFQDDELLEGDILGNITLFEAEPDVERAWQACASACIEAEVRAMPMQLLTMVGERGTALSGGQRQRLLIARALYHRPQLLLLDEATSQLDVGNERAIHRELRRLGITVILVSHRPEAVAAADRTIRVGPVQPVQEVRANA